MAGMESNLSIFRLVQNMKDEVARGKSEVIELSKNNRLTHGNIDSYTSSIDRGLNNLALEVCGLEAKLRIITKERDNLLDTVNHLRGEITQLSAKLLPTLQPLPLPELTLNHIPEYTCEKCPYSTVQKHKMMAHTTEVHTKKIRTKPNNNQDIQEVDSPDDPDDPDAKRPRLCSEDGEQEEHENCVGNTDQLDQEQIQIPSHDLKDRIIRRLTQQGPTGSPAQDGAEPFVESPEYKCEKCAYSTAQKQQLIAHTIEIHLEKIRSDGEPYPLIICDQCPYSTTQKQHMMRHREALHEKIKDYRCEGCEYATSRKGSLKRHIETVHMKTDKKFRCEQCPHSTAYKQHLKEHMANVHNKTKGHLNDAYCKNMGVSAPDRIGNDEEGEGRARIYTCERCDYRTSRKANLKGHVKYVHEGNANMFGCDHCDYMAERKDHMQNHLRRMHGIADVKSLILLPHKKVGAGKQNCEGFPTEEQGEHEQTAEEQPPSQIKEVEEPPTHSNIDEEINKFILPPSPNDKEVNIVNLSDHNDKVMKLNGKPVDLLSVVDLKKELSKRDLPKHWTKTGKKRELVQRLKNYLGQNPHECDPDDPEESASIYRG